jgi:hypothetical protein
MCCLASLQVASGVAVQPRVVLSKTLVDFETKVVIRSNQIKAPYFFDIFVTNQGRGLWRGRLGARVAIGGWGATAGLPWQGCMPPRLQGCRSPSLPAGPLSLGCTSTGFIKKAIPGPID